MYTCYRFIYFGIFNKDYIEKHPNQTLVDCLELVIEAFKDFKVLGHAEFEKTYCKLKVVLVCTV